MKRSVGFDNLGGGMGEVVPYQVRVREVETAKVGHLFFEMCGRGGKRQVVIV